MDKITFCRPQDIRLAPRKELHFSREEETPYIKGYPEGVVWWNFVEVGVSSLQSLAKALHHYATQKHPFCVVRGRRAKEDDFAPMRRAFDTSIFGEEAGLRTMHRRWVCLDIDKGFVQGDLSSEEGCATAARELTSFLPKTLAPCESIVHFSSTSSHQKVKGHIWLWLPSPVCDESLRDWARERYKIDGERVFDAALYSPNQPHYLADPLIIGEPTPTWRIAKRWHFLKGQSITKENMPIEWLDSYQWIEKEKRESLDAFERRMSNFKPKSVGKERAYAAATATGLANDILKVQGREGERHETVRAAAMRALKLKEEGVLEDYHIEEIKDAAYCVIPKNRHRDVDRLFNAERIASRGRVHREVPLKMVAAPIPQDSAQEKVVKTDNDLHPNMIPDEAIPIPLLHTINGLARKWKHRTHFWTAVGQAKEEYDARIAYGMTKYEAMADLGRFLNIVRAGWDAADVPLLLQIFPFAEGRKDRDV